jgi:hypothetical protein
MMVRKREERREKKALGRQRVLPVGVYIHINVPGKSNGLVDYII